MVAIVPGHRMRSSMGGVGSWGFLFGGFPLGGKTD